MQSIASNFNSLIEYAEYINQHGSKSLQPSKCGHCGKSCLRCHGYYPRKADRENLGAHSLNPILIPRYFCKHCHRTCSVLPKCISPRRWYLWAVQQVVLLMITLEHSLRYIANKTPPVRSTITRWKQRFTTMFPLHAFHLKSKFPELGRNVGTFCIFWKTCLEQMSLAEAMIYLHCAGEPIP